MPLLVSNLGNIRFLYDGNLMLFLSGYTNFRVNYVFIFQACVIYFRKMFKYFRSVTDYYLKI